MFGLGRECWMGCGVGALDPVGVLTLLWEPFGVAPEWTPFSIDVLRLRGDELFETFVG
jgi:hypothetical protein